MTQDQAPAYGGGDPEPSQAEEAAGQQQLLIGAERRPATSATEQGGCRRLSFAASSEGGMPNAGRPVGDALQRSRPRNCIGEVLPIQVQVG